MPLDDEPAAATPGSSTHSAHISQRARPRVRVNDRIVMAGSIATARAATIYTELIRRSPSARGHSEGCRGESSCRLGRSAVHELRYQ